ncbi:uncharacterized protein HMPREF1541_01867 [Cyphellophora europaea CBS 101466]|uniref:Zn(2)-C6 fungal-type domain-containing protein n=1 Tax=Cyphellophora europaea (strain CBS 101466) TaxID=1220924 RepID=W2S417_CYPE1|nr:uncharacterized protein HMPREF1541_01867 [Cyphellophora europaea CBS 101466]ETN42709.1 hypothetical protein HMPREF1541_01867 [Cyphellophora europaea CBS 101466]
MDPTKSQIRCKERRVRCDQKKPSCSACQKLGLECAWRPVPTALPISLSNDELRSFQFYRENTAHDLRGYVDDGFWGANLLRMSHGSKYLEHFIVSLSSLDEAFHLRTQPNQIGLALQRYRFSLDQYQIAIGGLLGDIAHPSEMAVVLAACLVCIAIELWHGNNHQARQHAKAGFNISSSLDLIPAKGHTSPTSPMLETLLPSLFRFCAELGLDVNDSFRKFSCVHQQSSLKQLASQELADASDIHARFFQLLDAYISEAHNTVLESGLGEAYRFIELLDQWYERMHTSTQKNQQLPRSYHLLAGHYHAVRAMLVAITTDDELEYDAQLEDFRKILAHCTEFLQLKRSKPRSLNTRRSPDAAVNLMLLFVAIKCRQPGIRRQAVRLMYRARRLEGLVLPKGCASESGMLAMRLVKHSFK